MHQVQLSDELYGQAARRAQEAGFGSVDAYVAEIVADDAANDDVAAENLDHLFTPERLAEIDAAAARMAAGERRSLEEVREHFRKRSAAWPGNPGQ